MTLWVLYLCWSLWRFCQSLCETAYSPLLSQQATSVGYLKERGKEKAVSHNITNNNN